MLEDNITGLKTGKGIEISPQSCCPVSPCLCPDPGIGSDRGRPAFESHQKGHHIGKPCLGKGNRQPEEGTPPEIKGKGSSHIAAKVHQRIPEQTPLADRAMGEDQERNLLDIIISVIKEQAVVSN